MTNAIKSILVAIDFGPTSLAALDHALLLAEKLGARLDLVHIYDVPMVALPGMVAPATNDTSYVAQTRQELSQLTRSRVAERVPAQSHLRVGEPVARLLDTIADLKPDLVIVGSHGRNAMMRALLGSVSERLCRKSPVPVLVVPAPERAAKVREAEPAATPEQAQAQAGHATLPIAWSCTRCGHIRGNMESSARCSRCGLEPATWDSAPVTGRPADELERAVGESLDGEVGTSRTNDPAGLFPTSPPGTEGYNINPELRVRY